MSLLKLMLLLCLRMSKLISSKINRKTLKFIGTLSAKLSLIKKSLIKSSLKWILLSQTTLKISQILLQRPIKYYYNYFYFYYYLLLKLFLLILLYF